MNADLSVAPEIAQLAAPLGIAAPPLDRDPLADVIRRQPTTGQLAKGLSLLAAAPQRWWDLVRFDPRGPVRVAVPAPFEAWLLVIPPGQQAKCYCQLATMVAGEAADDGSRLRQGRVRVHGAPGEHLHGSAGHGYSVTLHASP